MKFCILCLMTFFAVNIFGKVHNVRLYASDVTDPDRGSLERDELLLREFVQFLHLHALLGNRDDLNALRVSNKLASQRDEGAASVIAKFFNSKRRARIQRRDSDAQFSRDFCRSTSACRHCLQEESSSTYHRCIVDCVSPSRAKRGEPNAFEACTHKYLLYVERFQ